MDVTLFKSIAAAVPIGMLFVGSIVMRRRGANVPSVMQVAGAACLMTVVATHMFEALQLFPWMGWGEERSIGHYVNVGGAVLGLTLFPAGYLISALRRRSMGEPLVREIPRDAAGKDNNNGGEDHGV
jgi:hypothetical protein